MVLILLAWLASVCAACTGILLTDIPRLQRNLVPLGGGLLAGIALFWVVPDLAASYGWAVSLTGTLACAALLQCFNHYVYPVCPTCAHSHEHAQCRERLHGFAVPLLLAASVHCVFDGWALVVSTEKGTSDLGRALITAVLVHKVPEGIVMGILLRSAIRKRGLALLGAIGSESAILAALWLPAAPIINGPWVIALFSLVAGGFLFLGAHAVHVQWRSSGPRSAIRTAAAGAAGSLAVAGISRLLFG